MNDILAWTGALGGLAALIAIVKFWMDMGATKTLAEGAARDVRTISTKLADYMLTAERGFATNGDLANAERRFADAVEGLRHDFGRMAERVDHLLERLIERAGR